LYLDPSLHEREEAEIENTLNEIIKQRGQESIDNSSEFPAKYKGISYTAPKNEEKQKELINKVTKVSHFL